MWVKVRRQGVFYGTFWMEGDSFISMLIKTEMDFKFTSGSSMGVWNYLGFKLYLSAE
tara:strand:+ start:467 stop:637 length:171 start_codon:yes stop_codon:yes gene_type:complete